MLLPMTSTLNHLTCTKSSTVSTTLSGMPFCMSAIIDRVRPIYNQVPPIVYWEATIYDRGHLKTQAPSEVAGTYSKRSIITDDSRLIAFPGVEA